MTTDTRAAADIARLRLDRALTELRAVARLIEADELSDLLGVLSSAPAVHWGGHGRSGLVARAVSMRLMHLGLRSFVIGETATPGLLPEDAVVLLSSSGTGNALSQATTAHTVGATVVALTAKRDTPLALEADVVCVVPARTAVPSVQHAGSLFEQSCLLLGDSLCGALQETLGVPVDAMNARHAMLQ